MSSIKYVDNFEEVDFAMMEKLSKIIVDDKEVKVTYYSPDVDLSSLEKPCIVFYRTPPFPDNSRWQSDEIRDNYVYGDNGEPLSFDVRKPPEPWSITYTIRTLYEYQTDGVQINRALFRRFPRTAYLDIHGIGYDISYFGGSLTGSGYKDFGKTEKGNKDFGETYNYRVDILLEMYDREHVRLVQEAVTQIDKNKN